MFPKNACVSLLSIVFTASSTLLSTPDVPRQKFHLYLLAGQSNMAGRGKAEKEDRTPHPRVMALSQKDEWVPAVEPLHFDKPSRVGVGPGLAFGKEMAEADPSVVIGLVPCAVGGTSIAKWEAGAHDPITNTHPYDDAIRRVRRALKDGVLKGICWHQGESDCDENMAASYGNRLEKLVYRLRQELEAPTVPFVCGELGLWRIEPGSFSEKVNLSLRHFPHRVRLAACVSSKGLKNQDQYHFDAPSARKLGRRYAEAMKKLLALPPPEILRLWPGGVPLGKKLEEPEAEIDFRVRRVSDPTLEVFLPPREKSTGASVVICPGGGYNILAIDLEGRNIARWLNGLGVAGVVLKYRLKEFEQPAPLLDAQQAIRTVRQKAREWKLDPHRVGILGFSAGGHLAGYASNSDPVPLAEAAYRKQQEIDCRPDFSILIYGVLPQKPAGRFSKGMYKLLELSEKTPPAFLVHAKNDRVPADFSVEYAAELKRRGIPCELQLYESGGHGYGLGKNGGEVATWPDRCTAWLGRMGLLKRKRVRL